MITRVKGPGWAFLEKLTSAQQNQVDINTTYAVDKRAGQTDTLASDVSLTGRITCDTAGTILVRTPLGIEVGYAGGLRINSDGGIILNTSPTDYPAFQFARSYFRQLSWESFYSAGGHWSAIDDGGVVNLGTITTAVSRFLDDALIDGATLKKIHVSWLPSTSHVSLPTDVPTLSVFRLDQANTLESLSTTSEQPVGTYANVAAYSGTTTPQKATFVCNQNNVINRGVSLASPGYRYKVVFVNESGGGELIGNQLRWILVEMTATSMRF
jgi:hypothetical protein